MRWQFLGGVPEDKRRAFLFTNVIDAKGRRYDMPVVVGAMAASPEIYAMGMGRPVERDRRRLDAGDRQSDRAGDGRRRRRARRSSSPATRCARPAAGWRACRCRSRRPGFDAAPYLTATLCITRDPETGIQNMGTYRAALKATDRLAVRMVAREATGAGGYLHWLKYRERGEQMPIAIVIGCAPVVMFTGPQKLAVDLDELGVAGALAGAPIRMAKAKTIDLDVPANSEIVIEGLIDPARARAGGAVRREQRLRRARSLQHADAGDRHHPQARAGVRLDHQPGDAERVERDQEGGLRARCSSATCATSWAIKGIRRVVMHERLTNLRPVIFLQFADGTPRTEVWRGLHGAATLQSNCGKIVIAVSDDIDPAEHGCGAVVARLSHQSDRGRACSCRIAAACRARSTGQQDRIPAC